MAALPRYASGTMLKVELNQAETFRGKKWHSVGHVQVVWIKPLTVGKQDASGQINDLTLGACVGRGVRIRRQQSGDGHGRGYADERTENGFFDAESHCYLTLSDTALPTMYGADYPPGTKYYRCWVILGGSASPSTTPRSCHS
ncbi:hypothetical protein JOF29_001157 [Kribbella aluminosa]|uniref:Uncharacterized protein n=1 Tax=Kribbella aluminosa TaxID=416017 RepID=A0ABS4UEK5_9ACTN|nr:hypothetical protein [Kribbella aluminosa]MBP2350074.1 hypothetical protein [Kribbella aluminosa]